MRTQLAPLIVVKQEFPDYRGDLLEGSVHDDDNNNNFSVIKTENDCNNNQQEDLSALAKKCKRINLFFLLTSFLFLTQLSVWLTNKNKGEEKSARNQNENLIS